VALPALSVTVMVTFLAAPLPMFARSALLSVRLQESPFDLAVYSLPPIVILTKLPSSACPVRVTPLSASDLVMKLSPAMGVVKVPATGAVLSM